MYVNAFFPLLKDKVYALSALLTLRIIYLVIKAQIVDFSGSCNEKVGKLCFLFVHLVSLHLSSRSRKKVCGSVPIQSYQIHLLLCQSPFLASNYPLSIGFWVIYEGKFIAWNIFRTFYCKLLVFFFLSAIGF